MENTFTAESTTTTDGAVAAQPTYILHRGTATAYLVLGVVLALSALLPWEKLFLLRASGLDVGRGWLVLLGGAVAAGTASIALAQNRVILGLRIAQFVAAIAGIGMFAAEYATLAEACKEYGFVGPERSTESCVGTFMGIGPVVALVAGATLGLLALFRGPTQRVS